MKQVFFYQPRKLKFFKQKAVVGIYLLLRCWLMLNVNISFNLYLQKSACEATSFFPFASIQQMERDSSVGITHRHQLDGS